jgi:hypothetical protein
MERVEHEHGNEKRHGPVDMVVRSAHIARRAGLHPPPFPTPPHKLCLLVTEEQRDRLVRLQTPTQSSYQTSRLRSSNCIGQAPRAAATLHGFANGRTCGARGVVVRVVVVLCAACGACGMVVCVVRVVRCGAVWCG